MNKVVLFGSTGLLGQAIYDRFSDFEGIQLFNPLRDEVDVTDFDSLSSYLKQVSPSHVINATGYNAVDMCEENPEPGFLLNSKVPEQIAKLSDVLDFIFIQFSSDYVFDGENPDGYREDAECNPINAYGESKARGEEAVMNGCSKYFLIRISWLFGPGRKNFVDTMLDLSESKSELSVVNDQFGKPTYTVDVADRLTDFLFSEDYGIYHLPNEDPVTWYEFAKVIFTESGFNGNVKPVSSDEFERLAKRPKCSILINTKVPKLRSHREALHEYLSHR